MVVKNLFIIKHFTKKSNTGNVKFYELLSANKEEPFSSADDLLPVD